MELHLRRDRTGRGLRQEQARPPLGRHLHAALAKLGYKINNRYSLGLGYLWEDYTIDSFILQDLQNYLPGALLLNANNGDYEGEVLYFDVGIKF